MSKHQEVLNYLETMPIGRKVSVRSVANFLSISEGTAYRAIKEAQTRGWVETRPRSGTFRVSPKDDAQTPLTYGEIVEVTEAQVLAGADGLDKEFSAFSIGAMSRQNVVTHLKDGGMVIVGDRMSVQELALHHDCAVLVTGGFPVAEKILDLANRLSIPILSSSEDTYQVASRISQAVSQRRIKSHILTVADSYTPIWEFGFLTNQHQVRDFLTLIQKKHISTCPIVDEAGFFQGLVNLKEIGGQAGHVSLEKLLNPISATAKLYTSLAVAQRKMMEQGMEFLPIIDEENRLLGVLRKEDLIKDGSPGRSELAATFSEQVRPYLEKGESSYRLRVAPSLLDEQGSLAAGVLTEVALQLTKSELALAGSGFYLTSASVHVFQSIEVEEVLLVEGTLLHQSRTSRVFQVLFKEKEQAVAQITIEITVQ
ncbi:CBS domain-containing protein [Streptococcus danieliae]|uniref:CBS domain-containing protein n=1 Tax=Streptococcus danieliae TaxID=747656 RepID=A0A7Z0LDT8_9STRE|nr:DRTGG domain-containing protein [Streptococcus danieliae]MBF0717573.1 CBS domain-containing protein [Streptococcus danieliae]NYS49503.1 CBS domain-containing protein [Streptococcus danieliae]